MLVFYKSFLYHYLPKIAKSNIFIKSQVKDTIKMKIGIET